MQSARLPLRGPFPYIDGLILQVTQNIGRRWYATGRVALDTAIIRRVVLMRLWMSMFINFSVMPLRISTITGFVLSDLVAIGGAAVIGEALLYSPGGLGLIDGRCFTALRRAADYPRPHW